MPKSKETARLISRGGRQWVLLPRQFHFAADRVQISKNGDVLILRPVKPRKPCVDLREWLDELERHPLSEDCFQGGWRDQPQFPAVQKSGTKKKRKR